MTAEDYAELGIRRERCTLGVGCDEAGVCYAAAHGQPGRCPFTPAERCDECGDETGECGCDDDSL